MCPQYQELSGASCVCIPTFIPDGSGGCKCSDYKEIVYVNGVATCACLPSFESNNGSCICPQYEHPENNTCVCDATFIRINGTCQCREVCFLCNLDIYYLHTSNSSIIKLSAEAVHANQDSSLTRQTKTYASVHNTNMSKMEAAFVTLHSSGKFH